MNRVLRTRLSLLATLWLALPLAASVQAKEDKPAQAIELPARDLDRQFMTTVSPMNPDATVNVVIGSLVQGAGQPACSESVCTGKVPRSVAPGLKGGSSEPLQALVLVGSPRAAGATVRGRPLAVLLRKTGDQRQALLIVSTLASPFGQAQNLEEVEAQSPGLLARLKAAFPPPQAAPGSAAATYEIVGRKATIRFVGDAISDFEYAYIKESDKRPLDAAGNPQLYPWPGARNIGE